MIQLDYQSLSVQDIRFIKKCGREVFEVVKKTFVEQGEPFNSYLKNKGISISVPSDNFLNKNYDDISFVFSNLPISKQKGVELLRIYHLIEKQLNDKDHKGILLFHEVNQDSEDWSFVNMFDNNVTLWIRLINQSLSDPKDRFFEFIKSHPDYEEGSEDNIQFILEVYFGDCGPDSFASYDLGSAILYDRRSIFKDIFDKTWGGGKKIEESFIKYLLDHGITDDDLKIFSGEGNFVDRIGIDLAVKIDNIWIPVQVKSSFTSTTGSIPYQGISVFPYNNTFYFVSKEEGWEIPHKVDLFFRK